MAIPFAWGMDLLLGLPMIADSRRRSEIVCPPACFTKTPQQHPPFSRAFLPSGNCWCSTVLTRTA